MSLVAQSEGVERVLRETGARGELIQPSRDEVEESDDSYMLGHHRPVTPPFFMVMPNEYDDTYYNVRFQSPVEPFYIVGVYLPLFGMEDISGGPAGTPDLRISVYQSGDQDDSTGFPTEAIDSLDFPFVNEDGDSLILCSSNSVIWNFFDLRSLQIGFNDRIDEFHIAVSSISDSPTDTIAIFHDNGDSLYNTDFSGFYDGQEGVWVKWKYLPGWRLGINFFIMVVISDVASDTSRYPPRIVSESDLPAGAFVLNPAYPNPFNSTTALTFNLPESSPYQVQLFDRMGRFVQTLGSGNGGAGRVGLDATALSTGTYFVIMTTPNGVFTQPIQFVK